MLDDFVNFSILNKSTLHCHLVEKTNGISVSMSFKLFSFHSIRHC